MRYEYDEERKDQLEQQDQLEESKERESHLENQFNRNSDIELANEEEVRLRYLAGIINSEDVSNFKKLIYRVTKGTTYTQTSQINYNEGEQAEQYMKTFKDPEDAGGRISKTVFMIIFSGGFHNMLKNKINRVC